MTTFHQPDDNQEESEEDQEQEQTLLDHQEELQLEHQEENYDTITSNYELRKRQRKC